MKRGLELSIVMDDVDQMPASSLRVRVGEEQVQIRIHLEKADEKTWTRLHLTFAEWDHIVSFVSDERRRGAAKEHSTMGLHEELHAQDMEDPEYRDAYVQSRRESNDIAVRMFSGLVTSNENTGGIARILSAEHVRADARAQRGLKA